MMDIVYVIMFCFLSFLIGFELGSWKEGKTVSKAIDDLSALHYKEIRMIVDKILNSRNDKKGGAE